MTKNLFLVAAIAAGFLIGVTGSANAQSYPSHIQFSNMHTLDGVFLPGAGFLTRTRNASDMQLALQGLDSDAAYTVWWIIFNDPEECAANPCGLDDLGTDAVHASALWATGFVTGADGSANVSAHLRARFLAEGTPVLFGPGLRLGNGFDAEIHAIVRSHGAAVAGETADQIGMFEDGDGDDQQAIMFLPN